MSVHTINTTLPAPLWQRELPAGRDRATPLSVQEIASAAFGIAEAENLQAASVKRVASRLHVPANRLEQYLPHREDLFDLMLDVCLSEVVLPDVGDGDWRSQLEQLAEAIYAVARAHPWLVEVIGARAPSGPNGLRLVERALQALSATGLDVQTRALCFNALLAFVCGSVVVETRRHPFKRADGRGDTGRYLADTVSAAEYPSLSELFADPSGLTSADSFRLGLDCLLTGIAERTVERSACP